jgi:chromosome segregation ATPase
MPASTNERQALERERAELPGQISAHQAELAATPATNKARVERLAWQIREREKRLADVRKRLAALQGRPGLRTS